MGAQPSDATAIEMSDEAGDIQVRVSAANAPTVTFGLAIKSRYEPIQCAVTMQGLMNEALGALWAQVLSERAAAGKEARVARQGDSDLALDFEARLARLNSSLDQARLSVETLRTGDVAEETRTAGSADRVWMEERGGFLLQIRIDSDFYANYSSDLLADETNACLAELIDTSRAPGTGSARQGLNGEHADE